MDACPKCGSTYGFYTLARVSGLAKTTYKWDGSSEDSSDMHDDIKYKGLKAKRCCQCHAVVKIDHLPRAGCSNGLPFK